MSKRPLEDGTAAPTKKAKSDDKVKTDDGKEIHAETDTIVDGTAGQQEEVKHGLPGYDYDEASGWYINSLAPEWQYNQAMDVHYNATEAQFYRQDPETQQFAVVEFDPNNPTGTKSEPEATEAGGLGKGELVQHIADYTFMQGRRPTQEDRHTILPEYGKKLTVLGVKASFYAVFDGHSGDQCSEFASKQLHIYIASKLKALKAPLSKEKIKQAIKEACVAVDKEFLRIAKIRKRTDGCCCIAVLLLDRTLFVINIGDSRAVVASSGKGVALSEDHKPENDAEKARVEAAGGKVIKYGVCWRITPPEFFVWEKQKIKQGPRPIQPAVARSFGDITLKIPRQLMVCTPDITVHDITNDDSLILLGCDGIWDVLSDQVAVDTALKAQEAGKDAKGIAGAIVKLAYEKGSTDNISVVAILLHKTK